MDGMIFKVYDVRSFVTETILWIYKVLWALAGMCGMYRAKPALLAAELGSFIFAVFPCDEKKAFAIAEAFDKRRGSLYY